MTVMYFGALVGNLIMSWMNDNLGRRKSVLSGLGMCLVGVLLIATSVNLLMAEIGLFCAGIGIGPTGISVLCFISETV